MLHEVAYSPLPLGRRLAMSDPCEAIGRTPLAATPQNTMVGLAMCALPLLVGLLRPHRPACDPRPAIPNEAIRMQPPNSKEG